jgi:hypothetical protein
MAHDVFKASTFDFKACFKASSSRRRATTSSDGVGTAVAPTQSSTQKAASNLSRRVGLVLVSAGFFLWERLSCWIAPMLEVRVAFVWCEWRVPAASVVRSSCIVWQEEEQKL